MTEVNLLPAFLRIIETCTFKRKSLWTKTEQKSDFFIYVVYLCANSHDLKNAKNIEKDSFKPCTSDILTLS